MCVIGCQSCGLNLHPVELLGDSDCSPKQMDTYIQEYSSGLVIALATYYQEGIKEGKKKIICEAFTLDFNWGTYKQI